MLIVGCAVIAAVLASFIMLGMPWNGPAVTVRPPTVAAAPVAAPAATSTNGLQLSTRLDSDDRPKDRRTELGAGTDTVRASFEYRDHDPNASISYLVRANGEGCPLAPRRQAIRSTVEW